MRLDFFAALIGQMCGDMKVVHEHPYFLRSASIDINPNRASPLAAGYSRRKEPFVSINDPLEMNLILLSDGRDEIAILSADLLNIGGFLRTKAEELLYPIQPQAVLFAASHTHFAPATEPILPLLGEIDNEYLDYLVMRLAQLVDNVRKSDPQAVRLKYFKTEADHSINRRRRALVTLEHRPYFSVKFNSVEMLPNPAGRRDETIHILGFYAANQRPVDPLAILWSYACHPVCFPDEAAVSADFPGVVRAELRRAHTEGIPVVYLQGFAGNIRPRVFDTSASTKSRIRGLLAGGGHLFGQFTRREWEDWSSSLANRVMEATKQPQRSVPVTGGIHANHQYLPLSALQDQHIDRPPIHFQRISLGTRLHIIALSAEPVCELFDLLPTCEGNIIPVGYTDHTFGYLPNNKILAEGGYEASRFRKAYSLPGQFVADIETPLKGVFKKLALGGGEIAGERSCQHAAE